MKGNLCGGAVTVTLVFVDEAHRKAWLTRMGLFDEPHARAAHIDYNRRKDNPDLIYLVGPEVGAFASTGEAP